MKNLNLEYIRYIAEPLFYLNTKGDKHKSLPHTLAKQVEISIPMLSNGDFDLEMQNIILEKYNIVENLKNRIKVYKKNIKNLYIKIDNNFRLTKNTLIDDIFITKKGLSKYTKRYGQLHQGKYPVYSASNQFPLTYIDTYDYNGKYLTWATNGFAGYLKVIEDKFSANGDRGILIPKVKSVDIDYIKFTLEPYLRELAKGRKGDKGSNEFTKVYPSMVESVKINMPILENGEFDLEAQQYIAQQYKKVEEIKNSLQLEITKIENMAVNY